ncbi:uncharacterized protein TNCV_1124061 [Trichonephila clavipes]|uniref:Uncharacterized protein n=1 Tax=Trichonephila clavipes TaxID=2585209 RepID=A0A8X6VKQ6_TRICX|nr:uncharacterized protein TNCV_1124061 [Trichonephila clavipes]
MSGAGDKLGFARLIINKSEALIHKFCSLTKGALVLVGPLQCRVLLTGAADIYQEQAPVERRGGLRSVENPPACVFLPLFNKRGGHIQMESKSFM